MKRYEAMFLFNPQVVRDWEATDAEVKRLMQRIGAELLVCVKFDERKLAYEIEKCKRGVYVLTYFDAEPERITELERDVQLSEEVLRVLVLRAESLTEERLAELRAHPADQPLAPMSGEGRGRHDDDREPRRGRGRDGEHPGDRDRHDDRFDDGDREHDDRRPPRRTRVPEPAGPSHDES